jgi:CBS domain-containing protein
MLCPSCGTTNLPGAESCVRCLLSLTIFDAPTASDHIESSLLTDPVSVLEPKPPVTVLAEIQLEAAIDIMMSHGVGALLVTNSQKELIGVLTERDFLTKIAGMNSFESKPVEEFMTLNPESVSNNDPLALAVRKMADGGYRHLPVVENGKPVGVISVRDVLKHLMNLCLEPKEMRNNKGHRR